LQDFIQSLLDFFLDSSLAFMLLYSCITPKSCKQ